MVRTSSKWDKFYLWSYIWHCRSRSIAPQNNKDLNRVILHLWSKFGDPNLNGSQVIVRTSKWLTHRLTHTRTHTQTQATTIPEGQNWPRVKMALEVSTHEELRAGSYESLPSITQKHVLRQQWLPFDEQSYGILASYLSELGMPRGCFLQRSY